MRIVHSVELLEENFKLISFLFRRGFERYLLQTIKKRYRYWDCLLKRILRGTKNPLICSISAFQYLQRFEIIFICWFFLRFYKNVPLYFWVHEYSSLLIPNQLWVFWILSFKKYSVTAVYILYHVPTNILMVWVLSMPVEVWLLIPVINLASIALMIMKKIEKKEI